MHWTNHHHLMRAAPGVDGTVLWANLHYLFWLSLIPFATAWMGRGGFAPTPTALYGASLLAAAVAHRILEWRVEALTPRGSVLRRAMGVDRKGWASVAAYAVGIALAFAIPWAAAIYAAIAVVWVVPDRRLERAVARETSPPRD